MHLSSNYKQDQLQSLNQYFSPVRVKQFQCQNLLESQSLKKYQWSSQKKRHKPQQLDNLLPTIGHSQSETNVHVNKIEQIHANTNNIDQNLNVPVDTFANGFDLGRSSRMPISLNLAESSENDSLNATPFFKDSDSAKTGSVQAATIEQAIMQRNMMKREKSQDTATF